MCDLFIQSPNTCLSDEKDHRPCCAQRGLPDRCLKLCQGYLIGTTFDDIDCLNYMPEVANCIQENKGMQDVEKYRDKLPTLGIQLGIVLAFVFLKAKREL